MLKKFLCIASVVLATTVTATAGALSTDFKIIDLTHPLGNDTVFWPGGVPFTMTRLVDYDHGYRLHKFEMGENTGTHVDAPSHFAEGKHSISDIPISDWVAPLVVIDVSAQCAQNPAYEITPADILAWEAKHGKIPQGAVLMAYTGWSKKFTDSAAYINFDKNLVMQFPGYAPDTADLLIARKIKGVGIDTLSLDPGTSRMFAFHHQILEKDIYQIENVNNLDKVPATGADVVIGVLPIIGGSQAQARIMAFVPK